MLQALIFNVLVAERPRFELGIRFWRIHAFQACLFSHSSIAPDELQGSGVNEVAPSFRCAKLYGFFDMTKFFRDYFIEKLIQEDIWGS